MGLCLAINYGSRIEIVDAVRAKGCPAELHLYPGEGHGWKRAANVADELERVEKFLRRHVLRLAAPPIANKWKASCR